MTCIVAYSMSLVLLQPFQNGHDPAHVETSNVGLTSAGAWWDRRHPPPQGSGREPRRAPPEPPTRFNSRLSGEGTGSSQETTPPPPPRGISRVPESNPATQHNNLSPNQPAVSPQQPPSNMPVMATYATNTSAPVATYPSQQYTSLAQQSPSTMPRSPLSGSQASPASQGTTPTPPKTLPKPLYSQSVAPPTLYPSPQGTTPRTPPAPQGPGPGVNTSPPTPQSGNILGESLEDEFTRVRLYISFSFTIS